MPLMAKIAPPESARAAAASASCDPDAKATGAVGAAQRRGRTARGTGVGLRVETTVAGVVVLGPACRAHREARHRRQGAVVRDPADDAEARPAVGAVGERVAVAPVGRVPQLPQAIGAGGAVRRDRRVGPPVGRALADREAATADGIALLGDDPLEHRQRRRVGREPGEKLRHRGTRALDLQQHPTRVVEHEAAQPKPRGLPVHVRSKADALHRSLDPRAGPADCLRRGPQAHVGTPAARVRRNGIGASRSTRSRKR